MSDSEVNNFGTIVFKFPVLHSGWECDNHGYVVQDSSGTNLLILSTHEKPYIADRRELEEKIAQYRTALSDSLKALSIL